MKETERKCDREVDIKKWGKEEKREGERKWHKVLERKRDRETETDTARTVREKEQGKEREILEERERRERSEKERMVHNRQKWAKKIKKSLNRKSEFLFGFASLRFFLSCCFSDPGSLLLFLLHFMIQLPAGDRTKSRNDHIYVSTTPTETKVIENS